MDSDSAFTRGPFKRAYVLFLGCFVYLWVGAAQAFCNSYQVKRTPGPSEEATFCKSSFSGLGYQVDQHFFVDGYSTRLIFSPRTANILCHEYELRDYLYSECKAHGIRSPYRSFESGGHQIEIKDLTRMSDANLTRLFQRKLIFQSTEFVDEIDVDQCVVVMDDDGAVTIAFDQDNPFPVANCLLKFEMFLTKNRDLIIR